MEKLFEARLVKKSEYDSLKELFTLCFEDSIEAVNVFFEKSVSPERVVAIFDNDKAVSSLYLLESDAFIEGVSYSAYYVYGVCTHPEYRNKGLMKKLFHFTEK
jgi:predicted acetyltransferase